MVRRDFKLHCISLTCLAVFYCLPLISQAQTFRDASDLLPPASDLVPLGASIVDINNDGKADIYRNGGLYVQQADGSFLDMHEQMGLDEEDGIVFGGIFGDYDADGFLDLFFMDLLAPSKLYKNRAGLGFVQTNDATGILDQQPVQGSLWTDFNQDGQIDLFVGIDGGISNLFLNSEDHVFTNISDVAGIDYRAVYGVAAADFDRDGDTDIFLTQCFATDGSDTADNVLYRLENGSFRNVSQEMGIVDDQPSWGTVWIDYNNDGWLDIFTANLYWLPNGSDSGLNTLYRNNNGLSFTDVSAEAGVQGPSNGNNIGTSAADFDNDGWVDLIVADRAGIPTQFYRNKGDGTFEDIADSLGVTLQSSQAVSVGDFNNDGWIDILLPFPNREQLLLNQGGDYHYIKISTRGTTANLFGIGARIDLYASGMHQVREITAGDGMTSQNHNLTAHFGLADQTLIDSLVVRWPGGQVDRLENIPADQEITIVQGIGINNPPTPIQLVTPTSQIEPNTENSTLFTWTTSTDPEQDPLFYTLHITGGTLDTTLTSIDSLSASIPNTLFDQNERYRWTVSVSDGHSVRGVAYHQFLYGVPVSNDFPEDAVPKTGFDSAYPNPFVSSVNLHYHVARTEPIRIAVYDILGHVVTELVDQIQRPGKHQISWNGITSQGLTAAPGIYFVQMTASHERSTRIITRH